MWRIKIWRGMRHVEGQAHRDARHRHRGFSHPARFEALESRLTLNVAPVASSPTTIPDLGAPGGVTGASGDPGSTAGTNPGSFSPVNTNGSATLTTQGNALFNQQVAFNTPYWIPNTRPLFTPPPSDELPANVNQAASIEQGIRNFSFGPDTSTHFSTQGLTLTVRRATNTNMAEDGALGSLEGTLLADAPRRAETLISHPKEAAEREPLSAIPLPLAERNALTEESPISGPQFLAEQSEGAAPLEPARSAPVHLEHRAVDQMMADGSAAEAANADLAIAQAVAENTDEPGEGGVLYALAASVSLATAVPIREHVWNKTDAARSGRRHRASKW